MDVVVLRGLQKDLWLTSLYHYCTTPVPPLYHPCTTPVQPLYCPCTAPVLPLYCPCLGLPVSPYAVVVQADTRARACLVCLNDTKE